MAKYYSSLQQLIDAQRIASSNRLWDVYISANPEKVKDYFFWQRVNTPEGRLISTGSYTLTSEKFVRTKTLEDYDEIIKWCEQQKLRLKEDEAAND